MHPNPAVISAQRRWHGSFNWDRIGIWLSSFCVFHCVATPLALLAIPFLGLQLGEQAEAFHIGMACLLIPVAFIAFFRGYQHHRDLRSLSLGVVGVLLLLGALVAHEVWDHLPLHTTINIVGSCLLITGHIRNRRLCHQCDHDHSH